MTSNSQADTITSGPFQSVLSHTEVIIVEEHCITSAPNDPCGQPVDTDREPPCPKVELSRQLHLQWTPVTSSKLKIKLPHQSHSPANTLRSSVPGIEKNSSVQYHYQLVKGLSALRCPIPESTISYSRRHPALVRASICLLNCSCYQYPNSGKTVLQSVQDHNRWSTFTSSSSIQVDRCDSRIPGLQNHSTSLQRYTIFESTALENIQKFQDYHQCPSLLVSIQNYYQRHSLVGSSCPDDVGNQECGQLVKDPESNEQCPIPEGTFRLSHPPLVKVQCALYQLVMDLGCLIPVGSSHPPRVKVQCALYQLVMDLGCLIPVGSSHPPLVKVQCALYQLVMDLIVQRCLIPVGSSHPPLVKVQCALYQLVMDLIVQGCLIPVGSSHPPLVKVQCALYQLVMDLGCLIPVGSSHPRNEASLNN